MLHPHDEGPDTTVSGPSSFLPVCRPPDLQARPSARAGARSDRGRLRRSACPSVGGRTLGERRCPWYGDEPTQKPRPRPELATMLATEHWSLLGTRSMTWSEIMSRISIMLTVMSAFLVVLALVAQGVGLRPLAARARRSASRRPRWSSGSLTAAAGRAGQPGGRPADPRHEPAAGGLRRARPGDRALPHGVDPGRPGGPHGDLHAGRPPAACSPTSSGARRSSSSSSTRWSRARSGTRRGVAAQQHVGRRAGRRSGAGRAVARPAGGGRRGGCSARSCGDVAFPLRRRETGVRPAASSRVRNRSRTCSSARGSAGRARRRGAR